MPSVDEIIELVTKEIEKKTASNTNGVYFDEPIIRRASQIKDYVPEQILEMKRILTTSSSLYLSEEERFYKQGKFMEDYEDSFDFQGRFERYFPTYRSMTDEQLRGYFSWRTRVRKGEIRHVSTSFAFVYIYELINLIGVKSPHEGFTSLRKFRDEYKQYDPTVEHWLSIWMKDFVVYYNLDSSLFEELGGIEFDAAAVVLADYKNYSDDEVYDAICTLSSHNIERSKFFGEYNEDAKKVICGVWDSLFEYYEKHRQTGLIEKLLGRFGSYRYYMFSSAIFFDRVEHKNYEYSLNNVHKYICKNGEWYCEKYYGSRGKSRELGKIIKTVDCIMRQKYGYGRMLKQEFTTKYIINLIEKEIDKVIEYNNAHEKSVINIDISMLDAIRRSADLTRDKLITEEELYDFSETDETPDVGQEVINGDTEVEGVSDREGHPLPLNDIEREFLRMLLFDEDYNSYLKEKKVMISVAADSINKKLFDLFGDTIIGFVGDIPAVIEDYADELKGYV